MAQKAEPDRLGEEADRGAALQLVLAELIGLLERKLLITPAETESIMEAAMGHAQRDQGWVTEVATIGALSRAIRTARRPSGEFPGQAGFGKPS